MHARFYSPAVGRFLSTDRIAGSPTRPQSWNLYAYTLDNPVNYTDPYGLQSRGGWRELFSDYANYGAGFFDFLGFGNFLRNLTFFNDNITVVARAEPNHSLAEEGSPNFFKAMVTTLTCPPHVAQGVSVDVSTISPYTPSGGGSYGLNLEYLPGQGLGFYTFATPKNVRSAGIDIGVSATFNAAVGSGPCKGKFLTAMGSYLYAAVGGFGTPSDQATAQSIGWQGAQVGVTYGLPGGVGETLTRYTKRADLSFLLPPWCR